MKSSADAQVKMNMSNRQDTSIPVESAVSPRASHAKAIELFDLAESLDAQGDCSAAADAYECAAEEHNYIPAVYNLACCYDQGVGRDINPERALSLFERAGRAGDADACFNAALLHESLGHPIATVSSWYESAAALDHPEALNNLGLLTGKCSFIAKSAFMGLAEAQYNFGIECHDAGEEADAAYWWVEAASNGQREAMFNLGVMYSWGHGVPQSMEASTQCFMSAARGLHEGIKLSDDAETRIEALYRLGIAHLHSLGCQRSFRAAGKYFLESASEGHAGAASELSNLVKTRRAAVPLPCSNLNCPDHRTKFSVRLKLCPGCKGAAYCGAKCQRHDWQRHRPICRKIKNLVGVVDSKKK